MNVVLSPSSPDCLTGPRTAGPEDLADVHADVVVLDGKVAYQRPSK